MWWKLDYCVVFLGKIPKRSETFIDKNTATVIQTTTSIAITNQAKGPIASSTILASYGFPLIAKYTDCENNDAPNQTKIAYQHIVESGQSSILTFSSTILSGFQGY